MLWLELILTIAAIGFVAWLVITLIPMPDNIRTVVQVVAAIAVLWVVLGAFGLVHNAPLIRLG